MLKHFSRVVTAFKSRRAQAQAWTLRGGVRNDEQSSAPVLAAYANDNLRFVSLCCPSRSLELITIETVITNDISGNMTI